MEWRSSEGASRPDGPTPQLDTGPQPDQTMPENRQKLLQHYYQMILIRRFEEKAGEMYTRAKMGGYVHLNIGEEATVVGAISALRPDDYLFSNYREHGHALARGIDAKVVMAELFGKETGTSKGRGGSMHIFDASRHFMGGYAIVGGQLPLAVGVALAIEYRNTDQVVLAMFGEGSTNIGNFHEALNMAGLWHLPIVFLCVNNQYAMGAPVASDSAVPEIWQKAAAYGMPGEKVDGMNLLAVQEAVAKAAERARKERVPTLLEAVTYRYRGHSMADPGRYRPDSEVKEWRARDPISVFGAKLTQEGILDQATADSMDRQAIAEVEEAVRFAEESPDPRPEELTKYVYADGRE